MKSALRSLQALPIGGLSRHPDVVLAVAVTLIISMLILPLPSGLLDGMLALNIAFAGLILISTLMSAKPLQISTFPSLLLITTLFRLSLNVSTTRMILSSGTAGQVVKAFGEFVVRGDVVVGIVVFLVLTLVQFMVIGKGAERVSEVGARFTLDAMPGKQMSIDAAERSGTIDEDEAQARRDELDRESQFYGAMDGAMKFIKGDAIAGLIITALNLVAGLSIGIVRHDMTAGEAAEIYSLLTIGDGLVSQIPALLITLSAGVLTTRVVSSNNKTTLGTALRDELLGSPKSLIMGAVFSLLLGLVPGLPVVPFFVISAGLGLAAYLRHTAPDADEGDTSTFEGKLAARVKQAKAQASQVDRLVPGVPMVAVELDPILSEALGFVEDADEQGTELIGSALPKLRDALFAGTGIRFPGVRVRSNAVSAPASACVIKLKDVPIHVAEVEANAVMAVEAPEKLARLGVVGQPGHHPVSGMPVSYCAEDARAALESAGVMVFSAAEVVALHIAAVLKRYAKDFIGLNEVTQMIERLEKVYPALVKEVVPKTIGITQLTDILRRLVDEGVSIRDLRSILEALAHNGAHEIDSVTLTEHVRAALSLQIAHTHSGNSGRLSVMLLEPAIEETVRDAIQHTTSGSFLSLEPELRSAIIGATAAALRPAIEAGARPVLLTTAEVRRYIRKLLEVELGDVAVLSFQELPPQMTIDPLGQINLPDELPAVA